MTAYRHNEAKKGYNPFDYPEEWEFFKHPFEEEEEDDILSVFLFHIRKMTRRLHLFFDDDSRLETAFYFGLLDSLSEVDDYLLGALKYARYCRLENLFFLEAHEELGLFLKNLGRIHDELILKISSLGDGIVKLNEECNSNDFFLRLYCELTRHGIPNDMLCALLRAPTFPSNTDKPLKIDKEVNLGSYFNNATVELDFTEKERNIEGAWNSSKLEKMLLPVDMLLWNVRGTLLWVVIKKIKWVCSNVVALGNRHDKLVKTIWQNAYKELCEVYARSLTYAKRRDEDLPQRCSEELYIQGRKPTSAELQTYFIQYRNSILPSNQSQQLYYRNRKREDVFCFNFIKLLLNDETHEDAEDFLFIQTFSKELSIKQTQTDQKRTASAIHEGSEKKNVPILEVGTLITKELKIEDGRHPHFPECLSVEDSKNLYGILSQEGFINKKITPLVDFNYLMGAANMYTSPDRPKPICWLKNKQMLREMLKLAFEPLLKNGTTQKSLMDLVPYCFVDKKGKPLSLANNDERQIVKQELDPLKNFFATISRANKTS